MYVCNVKHVFTSSNIYTIIFMLLIKNLPSHVIHTLSVVRQWKERVTNTNKWLHFEKNRSASKSFRVPIIYNLDDFINILDGHKWQQWTEYLWTHKSSFKFSKIWRGWAV